MVWLPHNSPINVGRWIIPSNTMDCFWSCPSYHTLELVSRVIHFRKFLWVWWFWWDGNRCRRFTLPGPDYFDEEAKCYGWLFEFFQVTFCHSKQCGRWLWQNFNNLLLILPPWQNHLVAAVSLVFEGHCCAWQYESFPFKFFHKYNNKVLIN